MVSSRRSALVLLASVVLQWTSASSHFSKNLSVMKRVKKELPFETRDQTEKSLTLVKDGLSLFKDVVETFKAFDIKTIAKSLSVFAAVAPGIGSLVFSLVNMVLAFIPQYDPVLNEVKKGFAEVNRKLDSLSIQISNLATDVEWFNYASVYSRDEVTILNAWDKFNDLRQISNLTAKKEEKLRLAEIFASFYENSAAESSVSNLYRYLTVSGSSLTENLNNLLRKKFKCDINKISRYNLYFSSLLWKGMVLNQFYWRLTGFNTATKEAEHVQMFRKVFECQLAAIDYCLQNYEDYMKKDVMETAKGLSSEDKKAVALKVKQVLDKKYNWYKWVVVVYNKADKDNHVVFGATEIDAGDIIVLVSYTREQCYKGNDAQPKMSDINTAAEDCFSGKTCSKVNPDECKIKYSIRYNRYSSHFIPFVKTFSDYATVLHAFKGDAVEVPQPSHQVECYSGHSASIHLPREIPACPKNECENEGEHERVLESNQWFCRCKNGYHGEKCDLRFDLIMTPKIENFTPIRTVQDRLKMVESKLVSIMNKCQVF